MEISLHLENVRGRVIRINRETGWIFDNAGQDDLNPPYGILIKPTKGAPTVAEMDLRVIISALKMRCLEGTPPDFVPNYPLQP